MIPFFNRGRVQGLIRRQLEREPKYLLPSAGNFPAGHKPLFIPSHLTGDKHLVESFFDALAVAALGLSSIGICGTGLSQQQKTELQMLPGPFYILPDANDEGAKAAREWVREFYPRARLCPAEYGEGREDVASLFAAEGERARETINGLKSRAVDALDLALSEVPEGSTRGAYCYAREHVLPLMLKIEDEGERLAALEDAAKASKVKPTELRRALKAKAQENTDSNKVEKEEKPEVGTERYERALELLKSSDLLTRAAQDLEQLGHVGEHTTKQLAFTCAISARWSCNSAFDTRAKLSRKECALGCGAFTTASRNRDSSLGTIS